MSDEIVRTEKTNDMTTGNPVKLIIRFMVPMCLGNIFQQFYNIADSIVAGQFIGVDALAAIGSTGALMFFCDRLAEWIKQWFRDPCIPVVRGKAI